jgi:hypothetical protein
MSHDIPRGITLGVPSFAAVATGKTFIFPNASFISAVNFTMVPSPMFFQDFCRIYFGVEKASVTKTLSGYPILSE